MEGCGPHCPCWRKAIWWFGQWGWCERDTEAYSEDAYPIIAGDLSRTKEQELENE